jgi:hypothetical protein
MVPGGGDQEDTVVVPKSVQEGVLVGLGLAGPCGGRNLLAC